MTFAIDDAFLPATLSSHPMTDDEFAAFCAEHPDLNFEMTAEGELNVMAPTYSDTGASNFEITFQLASWARKDRRGYGCDSSTGFVLPNGARVSPDASWTLKSRVQQLGDARRKSFWHLCPDFVIEVKSDSDRLRPLQNKMGEYLEQGAQLGWLIDPENKSVGIYRPNGEVEKRTGVDKIEGEGPVAGFVLDLTYVWDPSRISLVGQAFSLPATLASHRVALTLNRVGQTIALCRLSTAATTEILPTNYN